MGQKTLGFTKKPINLDDHKDFGVTRIRVGSGKDFMVFTMKNCQEIPGHDDSLPYVADLYCDGKMLCKCHNDGWGGETEFTVVPECASKMDAIMEHIGKYQWVYKKHEFDLNLCFIADTLATTYCN